MELLINLLAAIGTIHVGLYIMILVAYSLNKQGKDK